MFIFGKNSKNTVIYSLLIITMIFFSSFCMSLELTKDEKIKLGLLLKYFPSKVDYNEFGDLLEAEKVVLKQALEFIPIDEAKLKEVFELLPSSMIEGLKPYEKEVILYLQSEFFLAFMKHHAKATNCINDEERKSLPLPKIDRGEFKLLGLTLHDINTAFMHLNNQNRRACYQKSMQELAYSMSVFDNALQHYTSNSLPVKLKNMAYLLSPSTESIKQLITYKKLDRKKKDYLSKLIGKRTYKSKIFFSLDELQNYQGG